MNLSNMKAGQSGVILQIKNHTIASKLMSLGVLPGKEIRVVRKSLLENSIYVEVNNHRIGLRKNEAINIEVKN